MTAVVATTDGQAVLAAEVSHYAARGWTVVSQTSGQASLVKGKDTNHLLHFFLSLFTLGFWVPVWIAVAVFSGRKSMLLTVDTDGRIRKS